MNIRHGERNGYGHSAGEVHGLALVRPCGGHRIGHVSGYEVCIELSIAGDGDGI